MDVLDMTQHQVFNPNQHKYEGLNQLVKSSLKAEQMLEILQYVLRFTKDQEKKKSFHFPRGLESRFKRHRAQQKKV